MPEFYAIGNKELITGKMHGTEEGLKRYRCSIFKSCPPIHSLPITEKNIRKNYDECDNFKIFETYEAAENYRKFAMFAQEIPDQFGRLKNKIVFVDFPIFTVAVKDNVIIQMREHACSDKLHGKYDKNCKYEVENHTYCQVGKDDIDEVRFAFYHGNNNVVVDFEAKPDRTCRLV